jgi:hypothetical protein
LPAEEIFHCEPLLEHDCKLLLDALKEVATKQVAAHHQVVRHFNRKLLRRFLNLRSFLFTNGTLSFRKEDVYHIILFFFAQALHLFVGMLAIDDCSLLSD